LRSEFFPHEFPHERSDPSHWRKRLGDKLELLLAEGLRVALESGALRSKDLKRVTVDTTVEPKNISFPKGLNRLANKHGVRLRQSYLRVAKRAAMRRGATPTPSSSTANTPQNKTVHERTKLDSLGKKRCKSKKCYCDRLPLMMARIARSLRVTARHSYRCSLTRSGSARRTASAVRCGSCAGIAGKGSTANFGRPFHSVAPK
jgi:hypothetical protein